MKTYYVVWGFGCYFLGNEATLDVVDVESSAIIIPNYFRFIYKSDYEHSYETMSKRIGG